MRKKITSINFSGGIVKNFGLFLHSLHKSKLNFHVLAVDFLIFFMNSQFQIQANCNDHVKFHRDLLIVSSSKLSLKIDRP